jgi:hypothetical protein
MGYKVKRHTPRVDPPIYLEHPDCGSSIMPCIHYFGYNTTLK